MVCSLNMTELTSNHTNNTSKRMLLNATQIRTRYRGIAYSFVCTLFAYTSLLSLLSVLTVVASLPTTSTLYSPTNHIQVLDAKNFSKSVYDNSSIANRVHLIQFYNSWCGHCISFAPTFKQLAKDIGVWTEQLMRISVVDCAQDVNAALCRDASIYVYPTLRVLWFDPKTNDYGTDLKGSDRSVDGLRHSLIKWFVDNWSKGVPRFWPDLMPVTALSKQILLNALPLEKGIPIVIVVETEKSFLGTEIILDLYKYRDYVTILRILDLSETLLNEILPQSVDHYKLPLLLTINNKDYKFLFLSMPVYSEDKIRQMYVNLIKSKFVSDERKPIETKDYLIIENENIDSNNNLPKTSPLNIFMHDLNNALRYSLFQEVALKKSLNTTHISALKNYLTVLELHFPFNNENARSFIKYLNEWLSKKAPTIANNVLETEDIISTMKIYEEYYKFPKMKEWTGCAGSDGKYRGYPCSLWTLFHVLTVSEYKNTLLTQKWATLHSVLYAMRDYIKYFFGCTSCAQHFDQMSQQLESELTHPNSSVIWLWKAHNQVNRRLKGDASEDPKYPKVQFPLSIQCPNCYLTNFKFNESAVFQFLLKHYSPENIVENVEKKQKSIINNSNKLNNKHNNFMTNSAKDQNIRNYSLLNGMDYSLILLLYITSVLLMVTLCVVLKFRFKRRAQKGIYNTFKTFSNA